MDESGPLSGSSAPSPRGGCRQYFASFCLGALAFCGGLAIVLYGLEYATPLSARALAVACGAALAVVLPARVFRARWRAAALVGAVSVLPGYVLYLIYAAAVSMSSGDDVWTGVSSAAGLGLVTGGTVAVLTAPRGSRDPGRRVASVGVLALAVALIAIAPLCKAIVRHAEATVLPRVDELIRSDLLAVSGERRWWSVHWTADWSRLRAYGGLVGGTTVMFDLGPWDPLSPAPAGLTGLRIDHLSAVLVLRRPLDNDARTPETMKPVLTGIGVHPALVEQLGPPTSRTAAVHWDYPPQPADLFAEREGLLYHVSYRAPEEKSGYRVPPLLEIECTGTHR